MLFYFFRLYAKSAVFACMASVSVCVATSSWPHEGIGKWSKPQTCCGLYFVYSYTKEGKERKSIYIAPLFSDSKRSDMVHTVLPANYTMPAFPS